MAAILIISPGSVVANVSPSLKRVFRLAKAISTCCLTRAAVRPARSPTEDPNLGQGVLHQLAPIGEVPENPAGCFTYRECSTGSSVESTIKVSGSPTSSDKTAHLRGSKKLLSLRMRRWNEEGARSTTPEKRCGKNRAAPPR